MVRGGVKALPLGGEREIERLEVNRELVSWS